MSLKAIANERRLQILDWLKDPAREFPARRSTAIWSRTAFARC